MRMSLEKSMSDIRGSGGRGSRFGVWRFRRSRFQFLGSFEAQNRGKEPESSERRPELNRRNPNPAPRHPRTPSFLVLIRP
jgi:hypothetical protein